MMSAKTWAELVRRARDIADQPSGADLTRAQMYVFSAQAQARSLHEQQLAALYGVPVDQLRAVEQATQWIPSRTEDSRPAAAAGGSTREAEQGSDPPCSPPAPLRSTSMAGESPDEPTKFGPKPRPVCADCGQTAWGEAKRWDHGARLYVATCSDCVASKAKAIVREGLDARIAAARKAEADPTSDWSAWSHPAAEGESW